MLRVHTIFLRSHGEKESMNRKCEIHMIRNSKRQATEKKHVFLEVCLHSHPTIPYMYIFITSLEEYIIEYVSLKESIGALKKISIITVLEFALMNQIFFLILSNRESLSIYLKERKRKKIHYLIGSFVS